MKFEITDEELEAVISVKSDKYSTISQLLVNNVDNDITSFQENYVEYTKETLNSNIELVKKIYTAIIKNYYNYENSENKTFYKETNYAEIDKLKNSAEINNFSILNSNKNSSKSNLIRPVLLEVVLDKQIPYIDLDEDEILLSPFTFVENITEVNNSENDLAIYKVELELQDAGLLDNDKIDELYEKILSNVELINEKIENCIKLDNDNAIEYENIRKLEQLLAKHNFAMEQPDYDKDTTDDEKQSDLDDIARINLELDTLKNQATDTFYTRQENYTFIANWKDDLILYLKNVFTKINEEYKEKSAEITEIEETVEEEIKPEIESGLEDKPTIDSEKVEIEEKTEIETDEIAEEISVAPVIEDEAVASVKAEALENVAVVNTLIKNIKNLISRQQNHARIAEAVDAHYKALNNAFEMKNYAEELDVLVNAISNKIDTVSPDDKKTLDEISKVNIQVSILLNYLNNAKSPVSKKINRFDEINIIEENELKKEIAETVKNIRCEAELKKLNDDIDIIEDKSTFRKFIGRFTGKNKLDNVMLDQIKIRQTAIRKTFKTKMPLSYNYSIHALIAEIEMFIKENEDDELVIEDVNTLRKIKETLKQNFVIIDSKVISIIDQKTGKNLPLASHKISKKEIIEIDTYRFLNKYGYDKSNDVTEPDYQDTLANEIKRIVDYIKTSNVLEGKYAGT